MTSIGLQVGILGTYIIEEFGCCVLQLFLQYREKRIHSRLLFGVNFDKCSSFPAHAGFFLNLTVHANAQALQYDK